MNSCVYCSKTTNLNTQLTLNFDNNQKVVVHICDEHAEDATIKSAKEAYYNRNKQIEEVLAQARALGLNIQFENGIITATAPAPATAPVQAPIPQAVQPVQQIQPQVVQPQPSPPITENKSSDNTVPTNLLHKNFDVSMVTTGLERHSGIDLNKVVADLPEGALEGTAEVDAIDGRAGTQIVYQKKRVDGTGTTLIKINKTTDRELQDRFKRMADDDTSAYERMRPCPLCRGNFVIKNGRETIICPKCNGTGEISII